ncbi:MAG: hypothetical protein L0Z70_15840 [Chloroflexi bacterium]|nr:hypothetical protein [Chloroflexota bacterium]
MSIKPQSGDIFNYTTQPARTLNWRTWLIGRPLPTTDVAHQTIGKAVGLAVFAADVLSSTAYGTQEVLMVLAVAGDGAYIVARDNPGELPAQTAGAALLTDYILTVPVFITTEPGVGYRFRLE